MLTRLRDAWWVLIGKAVAVAVPQQRLYQDDWVPMMMSLEVESRAACRCCGQNEGVILVPISKAGGTMEFECEPCKRLRGSLRSHGTAQRQRHERPT